MLKLLFQSTPSVKRVTTQQILEMYNQWISIHTLCEEGDHTHDNTPQEFFDISIHTLCEEGDIF